MADGVGSGGRVDSIVSSVGPQFVEAMRERAREIKCVPISVVSFPLGPSCTPLGRGNVDYGTLFCCW